jgi:hypothetical protein
MDWEREGETGWGSHELIFWEKAFWVVIKLGTILYADLCQYFCGFYGD